jgi:hypothetical protein
MFGACPTHHILLAFNTLAVYAFEKDISDEARHYEVSLFRQIYILRLYFMYTFNFGRLIYILRLHVYRVTF